MPCRSIRVVNVRVSFPHQALKDFVVTARCGVHDWCLAAVVSTIDNGSPAQQKPDDPDVTPSEASYSKGRRITSTPASGSPLVDGGLALSCEILDCLLVIMQRRQVKRRLAILVSGLHGRAFLQTLLDRCQVALFRSRTQLVVQRIPAQGLFTRPHMYLLVLLRVIKLMRSAWNIDYEGPGGACECNVAKVLC